jgi:pyruvate/2-oxoglutarate/acetoin dehydrogenase E1 component
MVAHIPGLKVVMPSTVDDAYSMIRASIRDDSPVVFVENRQLYGRRGDIGTDLAGSLPIGRARVVRHGDAVTVVTYSRMVEVALEAADQLAAEGIGLDVIDLRSLVPLDIDTVIDSVTRTRRAIVLHEAWSAFGAGAEIASQISERAFDALAAPVRRIGSPTVPMPFSPSLEKVVIPDAATVVAAARDLIQVRPRNAAMPRR